MSKIYDNLYLGNITASKDNIFFKNNKIKNVLIAAKNLKRSFPLTIKYHQLDISDNPTTIILKYWPESITFLEETEGNTLVHCQGGKSRSASTVMAYVMFKQNISAQESILYVRKCHKFAYPNSGFLKQLEYWEDILQEYRLKVPFNSGKEDFLLLQDLTSQKLNEVTSSIIKPSQSDLQAASQKLNFIEDLEQQPDDNKKYMKSKKRKKNSSLVNQNKLNVQKIQNVQNDNDDNNEDDQEEICEREDDEGNLNSEIKNKVTNIINSNKNQDEGNEEEEEEIKTNS